MTVEIRDAKTTDIEAMLPLLAQLFAIEEDFTFNRDIQKRGLSLMLDGCGKHRAVKVACKNKSIIGMCTAQTRISTASGAITAVVEDMVVDRAFQGKGIGRQLLLAIEDWARIRGISGLSLLADKNNIPALQFYSRLSWQPTRLTCLTKPIL